MTAAATAFNLGKPPMAPLLINRCVQESTFTSHHKEMEDNGNGGGDDSSNHSADRRTKEEMNTAPVRRMEKKRVHKSRQLEGDETEDSEDSDGSDVLTRVSTLYLSTTYNPDRPRSPPPKTEEEEPVLLSDREEFDDEETEDSEDGDDTDSVSTRLSTKKPRVSDPKPAQNPEPVKVKKELTVQHVSVKTISQDTTEDDGQGSSSTKDGPSSLPPPTSDLRSGQNKPTEGEGVKNPNEKTNGQAPRPLARSCHACRLHHGSMRMLVRHAWTHINDVELLCGVCGHQSDSSHALQTHLQTHQKVLTCKICTKVFLSIRGFEEHMERHKGRTPSYRCRVCSKTFTNMSELQKHKEVHANEPQRKCETCQKSFSSDLTLRLHLLTHKEVKQDTGSQQEPMLGSSPTPGSGSAQVREKGFSCDVCGRRFFTMVAQQAHMEKHDQQKASS